MDVTTLVKDWVLSVNGTLDNSLTAFQDALLVLWSVAMRRWDLFLEFFLTTLPLNISLLFDFVLEEFYILYSASATTLSLTLQETLSRLETTNELIQKVALQWTQSFLNALQMAISKIDFQVCVLLVLCLNLGLLAFMVFQKSSMEQQIKFLSDEVRSIRALRLNTSQKEDQKDAPISLMPSQPIPPPPPPPMPTAVAGQYKRTLQPAKKQEETPSTMASVIQELMQAKRRVMTMITTPRKAYLDRKDDGPIAETPQPVSLFKKPAPVVPATVSSSENENPKSVTTTGTTRRRKNTLPSASGQTNTGRRSSTVMTRNQKKQAVIEQAGQVAKQRITATYSPSVKSPLRSSFSLQENVHPSQGDVFVPKESTLHLMDELRRGVSLNRTHIPMSPGGTTLLFTNRGRLPSQPRTYSEQIMESLKLKFSQAYGALTPAPPKRHGIQIGLDEDEA